LKQLFQLQADAAGIPLETVYERAKATIPMKRLGTPQEMANLITFLASEQASYITGTNIAIDGGLIRSL
ncbi:MAG: SDR family oxidoreductase, partial [Niabella sp.]